MFASTEGHERTGASSGIGLALAELLAKSKEYIVIATARKPEVIKEKGEGMCCLDRLSLFTCLDRVWYPHWRALFWAVC